MVNIAISQAFSGKGVGADLQMIWISGDSAQRAVIRIISLYISLDIIIKFQKNMLIKGQMITFDLNSYF